MKKLKYVLLFLVVLPFSAHAQGESKKTLGNSALRLIAADVTQRMLRQYDYLIALDKAQTDSLVVQQQKIAALREELRAGREQSQLEIERLRAENVQLEVLMRRCQRMIGKIAVKKAALEAGEEDY